MDYQITSHYIILYEDNTVIAHRIGEKFKQILTHSVDGKIKTVSSGWSYESTCYIHFETTEEKFKYVIYDTFMNSLSKEHTFKHKLKSIQCGDEHQMFLCENGDLYGEGENHCGQLGVLLDKLTELTLLQINVSAVATLCNGTLIEKNSKIWSTGFNEYSQIGHDSRIRYVSTFKKFLLVT